MHFSAVQGVVKFRQPEIISEGYGEIRFMLKRNQRWFLSGDGRKRLFLPCSEFNIFHIQKLWFNKSHDLSSSLQLHLHTPTMHQDTDHVMNAGGDESLISLRFKLHMKALQVFSQLTVWQLQTREKQWREVHCVNWHLYNQQIDSVLCPVHMVTFILRWNLLSSSLDIQQWTV